MPSQSVLNMFFYRIFLIAVFFAAGFVSVASAQQPTPTVAGKSYNTSEIRRPTTTAPQFPSPVTFSDVTSESKITFKHAASPTSQKYLLETMGAGAAMFDFDNDGRLDLFFTNGARLSDPMPKGKMPEKTDPKYWNRLYRQKSDGTFEDVTEKAGVKGVGYSFGVATGDYDRDGFMDLFVTGYGGALLYRNNGDGTFTEATKKLSINVEGWATSAGFFDYDRDGRLDLFVTRYLVWDFEKGAMFCGDTRPDYRAYCHPDNFKPINSLIFQQKLDGTFQDVSEKTGIAASKGKALGVAFADFDDDGWTDVFVANDNSEQQLFRNKQDGTFEDLALAAGAALDDKGKRFSGMGVDVGDYDGDGRQDVIITTLSNETYPLYRNLGENVFDYVTQSSGIGQISILGTGWGVKFTDVDNDGRRDVFVAQSHVLDTIEKTSSFLKYKQAPLLMRNSGREFQNVSFAAGAAFKIDLSARGMTAGDLDNDGDTDFAIAQTDGAPVILRNNGTKNHWIGIDLRGDKSAPRGEGSRVVVTDAGGRKQIFDVSSAGSYISANDTRVLVGLGESASVKQIEIRWTSGKIQKIENPAIDRYHVIKEQ
ncbi:MAG: CRTAC1 family protein [Acidobacteriota bacterium]|nr:CRTAC1 family protein [Acidobacteriota bacterium]